MKMPLGFACRLLAGGLLATAAFASSLYPPQTKLSNASLDAAPDPVSASDGSFYFDLPLLQLGGPMGLGFRLSYDSTRPKSQWDLSDLPEQGKWWWDPKATCLFMNMGDHTALQFQIERGDAIAFVKFPGETWRLSTESDYGMPGSPVAFQLAETNGWLYLLDPRDGCATMFDSTNGSYRIRAVVDRNGNYLRYAYDPDHRQLLQPVRIEDSAGRFIELTYTNIPPDEGYIASVADHAGRIVRFHYASLQPEIPGAWHHLTEVVDVMGGTNRFEYTYRAVTNQWGVTVYRGLLAGHRTPAGRMPWRQEYDVLKLYAADYDDMPVVSRQTDACGKSLTFQYDTNAHTVAVGWTDGGANVFRHGGRGDAPRELVDPEGGRIGFEVNAQNQIVTLSNRLGGATSFTYDPQTLDRTSVSNALGREWAAEYLTATQSYINPFTDEVVAFPVTRVSRVLHADNSREIFAYDAAGNMTARVDRAGGVWSYQYDARGFPAAASAPAGGLRTYACDAYGQVVTSAVAGPIGMERHIEYDARGMVTGTVNALGGRRSYERDSKGRIVQAVSELGRITGFAYDADDNVIAQTDAAGQVARYAYDAMGRLSVASNRLGHATRFSYDAMGRLATVTDPNGIAVSNAYTTAGDILTSGFADGGRWQTTYNAESMPVSFTAPSGAVWHFGYDPIGNLLSVTNPLGHASAMERDAMGRIRRGADAAGCVTRYLYDDLGRLAGVSNAAAGEAGFAYDARGLLTRLTDSGGAAWIFNHGPEGLPATFTDPLGRQDSYAYDSAGRLVRVERTGGGAVAFQLDAQGAVTQIHATATGAAPAVTITNAYDLVGRLAATDELRFQYDAAGRLTNTVSAGVPLGAAYDAGSRLVSVCYNGVFTVQYQYDRFNRLTNVADSVSGASVAMAYDADGRLMELRRGNGVDTAWTRDAAGQPLTIRHGAVGAIDYAYDASGCVVQEVSDLPLATGSNLVQNVLALDYDAACQIGSAGYAYDAWGRLTNAPGYTLARDALGRVVEIRSPGNAAATYAYNGMHTPIRQAVGGTDRVEHAHHALGGAPLAAVENRTAGRFERFYVWTPDGRLLYMTEGAATVCYYHFDRMGNTLFLTDGSGAVVQRYAYTPCGQVVAAQGVVEQPFQFCGADGVRKLPGPDGLYRMGARCYDAATARFLSPEPDWPRPFEAGSLNPYNYADSSPTRWSDPGGLAPDVPDAAARSEKFENALATLYNIRGYSDTPPDWLEIFNDLNAQGLGEDVQHFLNKPDLPRRLAALEALARRRSAEAEAEMRRQAQRAREQEQRARELEREAAEKLAARRKLERQKKREDRREKEKRDRKEWEELRRRRQAELREAQADKAYALAWRQALVNKRRALGTPKFSGPEADRWSWYREQEDEAAREIYRLGQNEQFCQESLDYIESQIRALDGR